MAISYSNKIISLIKQILPKNLFGRFLLIIIIPAIIAQILSTYLFYERHWSSVSSHMITSLVGEINMIYQLSQQVDPASWEQLAGLISDSLNLKINLITNHKLNDKITVDKQLIPLLNILKIHIKAPINVNFNHHKSKIKIAIELTDKILELVISRKRLDNQTTYIFIFWMISLTVIFLGLSIIFLRNQLRAIDHLARVAEQFGKGQDILNFKPTGAREVKKAANAFLQMKDRIAKQIIQRTEMLAWVSHDLKTPLTRMKLQLAMFASGDEIDNLKQDIQDMECIVNNYLDFAKQEEYEKSVLIDFNQFIQQIINNYNQQQVQLRVVQSINLLIKINLMRRAIINLIENALRYADRLEIKISLSIKYLIVEFNDNGPGIPIEQREAVFDPFYRLGDARNLNHNSTGLGLAITKNIISSHGGKIYLADSEFGGLSVIIWLPL